MILEKHPGGDRQGPSGGAWPDPRMDQDHPPKFPRNGNTFRSASHSTTLGRITAYCGGRAWIVIRGSPFTSVALAPLWVAKKDGAWQWSVDIHHTLRVFRSSSPANTRPTASGAQSTNRATVDRA